MDTMEYAEMQARGIPLDHQGRVSQESLTRLRQALAGQQLALDNLGGFLKFANRLLEDAEKCREAQGALLRRCPGHSGVRRPGTLVRKEEGD